MMLSMYAKLLSTYYYNDYANASDAYFTYATDAYVYTIDSETTYEIIRAMKLYCNIFGTTVVISLLQPTPEVFYTFDDLILLG